MSASPASPLVASPRARLDRSLPVLGAFAVGAIAYGGLYCFPPLSLAFARDFGVGRALAVTPWTVFLLVTALSSPLLGRAYDVILDRQLLLAGMLVLAVGWLAASVAPDIGLLTLAYGIFLAVGLELVFVGTTTAIARRYAGVAGLALGVAYAGPGVGVAIALPVVTAVLRGTDWRVVTAGFAALSLVGIPFVLLMTSGPAIVVPLREPPGPRPEPEPRRRPVRLDLADEQAHGILRETSAPGAIGAAQEHGPRPGRRGAEGLRRTLRTRRFWLLFVAAAGIGAADEGVFQAFLPHATGRGMSEGLAAEALALQSLAYVVGQIAGGALSDRVGRRFVGVVIALATIGGLTGAFAGSGDAPALAIGGLAVHGFGLGATIAIRSAAFSDVFGGADFGALFGVLAIAYPTGGIVATEIGAVGFDRLGTYWPAYWTAVVSMALWAVGLWVAGPRRHGLRARLVRLRDRLTS
ncbi:MAG TPA: MFS transporter [Candidatus Limnocylindrales bacterium]